MKLKLFQQIKLEMLLGNLKTRSLCSFAAAVFSLPCDLSDLLAGWKPVLCGLISPSPVTEYIVQGRLIN